MEETSGISDADLETHKNKIQDVVSKFKKAENMLLYLTVMTSAKEPILKMMKQRYEELTVAIPKLEFELCGHAKQIEKMSAYLNAHKDSVDDVEESARIIKKMEKMAKKILDMRAELGDMGPKLIGELPPKTPLPPPPG